MNARTPLSRSIALTVAALAAALVLTSCGADDATETDGADVTAALAAAKAAFDAAPSVHLVMSTDARPTSGNAVLGAEGDLTQQPAFQGEVSVLLFGGSVKVPVIAVDGKVYAKILTPTYGDIDPAEYGAPDPADFADPETGISALLTRLEDAEQTGEKRDGNKVVTTYAGTLAGSWVASIIPSADQDARYRTVIGIDQEDRIATLAITGPFFEGSGDVTYDLSFDDYDKNVKISAP